MRWVSGIPTNIFRDGDPLDPGQPQPYVLARLNEGPQVRAYYMGDPPCPLLPAWFYTDGIRWWCHGSQGFVRPVLREHFMTVPTATADGVVACDTPWNLDVTGASSQIAAVAGSGTGVIRLTAGNASGRSALLHKDATGLLPSSADGFWVQSRVQIGQTTSFTVHVGLSNNETTGDNVTMRVNTGTNSSWALRTLKDAAGTTTATADVATTGAYHWVDLFYVSGVFAAGWFDGDGPYSTTSNIPVDALEPYIICGSLTTATKTFDVDCYFLDAIDGDLVHPADPFLKP